jgi:hypothetical protein
MNIEKFYRDYSIRYVSAGEHKHAREGWINIECPFCTGNAGYHLGFDLNSPKFVCWRCGGHSIPNTIAALLNLNWKEVYPILKQYDSNTQKHAPEKQIKIRRKILKFPEPLISLNSKHRDYLEGRGFDPDWLIEEYDLKGTGPMALLEKLNYKHRIVIPYYWDSKVVSFDTRDITGKAQNKYQACPDDREVIPHKSILYGRPDKWKEVGICVEGSSDVWRFGFNSFAVSGIKYTPAQVRVIANTFKRVPVVFDDDPQAKVQANKLVAELKFRGIDAFRIDIKGDPGAMSQTEANYLVKQLI